MKVFPVSFLSSATRKERERRDLMTILLKRDVNEMFPSDSEKDNVNRNGQRLICTKEASKVDVKG